mgnify:CR=1 FL=1
MLFMIREFMLLIECCIGLLINYWIDSMFVIYCDDLFLFVNMFIDIDDAEQPTIIKFVHSSKLISNGNNLLNCII